MLLPSIHSSPLKVYQSFTFLKSILVILISLRPNDIDYMKERKAALQFWETGDPNAEWIEFIPEDLVLLLPQNREPVPASAKVPPPLVRSGSC
jgi:hypothetical protein